MIGIAFWVRRLLVKVTIRQAYNAQLCGALVTMIVVSAGGPVEW